MQTLGDTVKNELREILGGMVVESESGCTECIDGYKVDFSGGLPKVKGECQCMALRKTEKLNEWKKAETEKLIQYLLPRYDLRKTNIEPWYEKLRNGSCWLWGMTGRGKTHGAGWALAYQISQAVSPFKWGIYKATDLIFAWDHQEDHSDDMWRYKSRNIIDKLEKDDVIHIEEIDKFGNVTDNRWARFFELFNRIIETGKTLRVTSQHPIAYFIERMDREKEVRRRDGVSPQEKRFLEMMKDREIEVQ